jgi:hypothetical protein
MLRFITTHNIGKSNFIDIRIILNIKIKNLVNWNILVTKD